MGHVLRAAAYRPRWTDGSRRVVGPDEDSLTLLAAALEAALDGSADSRPCSIRVLGAPIAGLDARALSALLGREVTLQGPDDGVRGLGGALASAREGTSPELVAAVRLADEGALSSPGAPPDDAAIALLVDGPRGVAESSSSSPELFGDTSSPVGDAFAAYRASHTPTPSGSWVGDWADAPREGLRSRTPGSRPPDPPPMQRSEGAYVPKPRYLESLRSRWGFLAERCAACGRTTFPEGGRCRTCGRTDRLETVRLPKNGGKVVARTWIGAGGQPTEFDPQVEGAGAYGVVLVDLLPGIRATLMVADAGAEEIAIGRTVSTRLRRLYAIDGEWRYGRKATPEPTRTPR